MCIKNLRTGTLGISRANTSELGSAKRTRQTQNPLFLRVQHTRPAINTLPKYGHLNATSAPHNKMLISLLWPQHSCSGFVIDVSALGGGPGLGHGKPP